MVFVEIWLTSIDFEHINSLIYINMKHFDIFNVKRAFVAMVALVGFSASYADETVTPGSGPVEPVLSSEESTTWYLLKSSHIKDAVRMNRYLKWDGEYLVTEQFNDGMTEDDITDDYRWKLVDSGDGSVVIINAATGKRIAVPADFETNGKQLVLADEGAKWVMKLTKEVNNAPETCVDMQYCFNYVDRPNANTPAYLNAKGVMDESKGEVIDFGITTYYSGIQNNSGWFFYEAGDSEGESTSLSKMTTPEAYYNSNTETLYTAGHNVEVFDFTGTLVLTAKAQEYVNLGQLSDGIYVAVVDGQVLKVVK